MNKLYKQNMEQEESIQSPYGADYKLKFYTLDSLTEGWLTYSAK